MSIEKEPFERHISEAKKRTNRKSKKKIYELISFSSRREYRLSELITYAANKVKISKAQYIFNALQERFAKDNVTLDVLSQPLPSSNSIKQPKQYMIYLITTWIATPQEYAKAARGEFFIIEDYVSTFQTLSNAKTYIFKKYPKKAHPEDWYFTIYGRNIEAYNKLEAYEKHKQLIKSAMEEQDKSMEDDSDGLGWFYWLSILNGMHKPDYVEIIQYKDATKKNADTK